MNSICFEQNFSICLFMFIVYCSFTENALTLVDEFHIYNSRIMFSAAYGITKLRLKEVSSKGRSKRQSFQLTENTRST